VKILDAQYIASGTNASQLPGPALPEIAFAGRSNVGKSSLLNALTLRKGLARTSKTPGHTSKINLFDVRTEAAHVVFADLPGYGFAARSKEEKKSWGPMIEGYLLSRPSLRALVLLVDARRGIEDDDRELVEFWAQTKKKLVLVGTKMDRLSKAHHKPALAALRAAAKDIDSVVIGFSAETGLGRDELWKSLVAAIS
jgi:GTP-binding protein